MKSYSVLITWLVYGKRGYRQRDRWHEVNANNLLEAREKCLSEYGGCIGASMSMGWENWA